MFTRRNLLGTATINLCLAAANYVSAQTASSSRDVSAEQSGGSLEAIVITAQRRTERQVDVPITVDQISGDQLAARNIFDTAGLQRVTSGLQLPQIGAWTQPALRGVSSSITTSGATPNVAFYLDGVYQPTELGGLMSLPDVQDVEVLKGPQGTLYGQNSVGGAIIVKTREPGFTPSGFLSLSHGNYNDGEVRGFVSGPLVGDVVAGSMAVSWRERDGFTRNIIDGRRDSGLEEGLVRGKLLLVPSDEMKFTLTGYWTRRSDTGIYEGQPYRGLSVASKIAPASIATSDPYVNTVAPEVPPTTVTGTGFSLNGEFDVWVGKLDFISSYSDTRSLVDADIDASPVDVAKARANIQARSLIDELDFASNKFFGVALTAGLYFQNSHEALLPDKFSLYNLRLPPTIYPIPPTSTFLALNANQPSRNEFYAAFIDVSYDLTRDVILTVGGRYTHQKMWGWYSGNYLTKPLVPVADSPADWSNFSPRFTARYKLTDNSNVYFSYAKGFKAGLVSVQPYGLPANPETIANYEVGYKAVLFDRLEINTSGFWSEYKNKQVSFYEPPVVVVGNAASARIKGIDASLAFKITQGLTIRASEEYLVANFTSFANAAVYVPNPATGGLVTAQEDLSGRPVDRAPKFSGTVSFDYNAKLQPGELDFDVSVYHSSTMLWDPNGLVRQNAYALLDAQIGFSPASSPNWRVSLYGTNLTDRARLAASLESGFAALVSYAPPRQFGVRGEFRF
jgi:iron complex outermembrane recepter protein